ncbi:MAG TPA: hypothetical protein PK611_06540 [Saprospiraceae bacterium]|nr:hypothetical protein [Saprospiraceae bacterium]HRO08414.1 hypothetical protein [Saprospiraceae bacterium]HRO73309.1 hypothetical protein [Saprospiraceae bacterium]HRP41799.1 hypothetical protein [Saprospiraceae bacterium]
MQFIPEITINQILTNFENEKIYYEYIEKLYNDQKDLMAFINEENQSLLTDNEIGILRFLTVVICTSIENHYTLPVITGKMLEDAEENNWSVFHDTEQKSFNKILDLFFENYAQEDLLALVEDSIQDDENEEITQVGREIIFVAAKSIIDTLDKNIGN